MPSRHSTTSDFVVAAALIKIVDVVFVPIYDAFINSAGEEVEKLQCEKDKRWLMALLKFFYCTYLYIILNLIITKDLKFVLTQMK